MKYQNGYTCGEDDCCRFVTKKEAKNNRRDFFLGLKEVQKLIREKGYPGFSFSLVGSAKRNMVFVDKNKDTCYDQDVHFIFINEKNPIGDHTQSLRDDMARILESFFNSRDEKDEYKWKVENSTSVITIKKILNTKIISSFDIALIDKVNEKILMFNKDREDPKKNSFSWNELDDFNKSNIYIKKINSAEIKNEYLKIKHKTKDIPKNSELYKPSCKWFIEAVNNVKNRSK